MVAAVARLKQFKMASILAATCTLDIKRKKWQHFNCILETKYILLSSCKIKIQEMKKKDFKLFGLTED